MNEIFFIFPKLLGLIKAYFNLALDHYIDNPWMKIVLAFIPALLGIAYPLLIQSVIRLDVKYNSSHIVEKFKEETVHKRFVLFLKISVILSLASFVFSFIIFLGSFISLCILLFYFFKFMNRLLDYQNPKKLFNLLKAKINFAHYRQNSDNEVIINQGKKIILDAWHPIIDLYKYSIVTRDIEVETDIRQYFIAESFSFFKDIEQKEKELVQFPPEFYNSSYDILSTYVKINNQDYYANLEAFVGYYFLPHTISFSYISQFCHEHTLASINQNISLLIEHEKNDKIIHYWSWAHQYMESGLRSPYLGYNEATEITELRNKIESHKEKFLELHYVIGAYLMHKRNFETLSRIWFFKKSTMPRYALMPLSLNEIFDLYFKFLDETWMTSYYFIKGLDFDSLENRIDIKAIVRRYACLLILRQWKIEYARNNSISFPQLPTSKSIKKKWIEHLPYIKNILEKLIENKKMLKKLELSQIDKHPENIKSPENFIDELILHIKDQLENDFATENLDEEAIKSFDEYSIKNLSQTLNNLQRISGNDVSVKDRDSISNTMQVMRGTRMLFDREVFLKDTGTTYLYYEELLSQVISEEMYIHVSTKFFLNAKSKYKVSNGKLFEAIDRLGLNKNDHVLIAFQVNLRGYIEFFNVDLKENKNDAQYGDFLYHSIPIFSFQKCMSLASKAVYVIKKADLPMIKIKDWSELQDIPGETKVKWENMDVLDSEFKLYKKFRELNIEQGLREEYLGNGKSEDELKNKIEIEIDFLAYCWFKKGVKIIEIKENEMFQEGGEVDELSKIKSF